MTIDEIIAAMPEPRRAKTKRRILALIHDEELRERADWTGITKLKEAKMRKKNKGIVQLIR
jgi:hypothetical protein